MSEQPNRQQRWLTKSQEEERRTPERFLSSYDLKFDSEHVWMTEATYEAIARNCGRYDGTWPVAEFKDKMFLKGGNLMWFDLDTENPENIGKVNSRIILIMMGHGPTRRAT